MDLRLSLTTIWKGFGQMSHWEIENGSIHFVPCNLVTTGCKPWKMDYQRHLVLLYMFNSNVNKNDMCKATQTIPHPSLLMIEQWAIINDQKHWSFRSASRSGCGTVSHHRGLKDFEFQTGNSFITLQKWSCEVWSWRLLSEQWNLIEGNRDSLFRWSSAQRP